MGCMIIIIQTIENIMEVNYIIDMKNMIIRLLTKGYSLSEAEMIADLANDVLREERKKLIHKILNAGFIIITTCWVIFLCRL